MVKQLVPLATISDEQLFPKGTVFRILNSLHALNPARPAHYDYMLVPHPEEEETMMSVNVTAGTIKAGYIISYTKAKVVYRWRTEEGHIFFLSAPEQRLALFGHLAGPLLAQSRELGRARNDTRRPS